jgi:voltage-gated potassium channel
MAMLPTDAENVFVTLTAHQANPSLYIVARAQQESSVDKLRVAGAKRVVCPQQLGVTLIADVILRPAVVDFVDVARRGIDLETDQLELSSSCALCGKTLRELELPRRVGVHVVAVRRANGKAIYHPTPDMQLACGDILILVGRRGVAGAVQKLQSSVSDGPTIPATK